MNAATCSGATIQRPTFGGPSLPGERLELVRRDRAALADDTVDRSVRPRLAHRANGRDLDDLTAADGLRPPALAEDEAIAGEEGHRLRDAQPHPARTCRARSRRRRARAAGRDAHRIRSWRRTRRAARPACPRSSSTVSSASNDARAGATAGHAPPPSPRVSGVMVDSGDVDGNSVARADASPAPHRTSRARGPDRRCARARSRRRRRRRERRR